MRTKGGPSKQRMAKGPEFEKLREHQKEWGACVQFARSIRQAVGENYRLCDFNLTPVWTGIGKNLMKMDQVNKQGERCLYLSTYKQALEGFSFNHNYPFNSVLRIFPTCRVNRETLEASVTFPRINTATDILNVQRLPYFRLIVSLGTVSDIMYNPLNLFYNFEPVADIMQGVCVNSVTEWFSADNMLKEQTVSLKMNEELRGLMTQNVSLVLSIGIEFGKVGFGGEISAVKHAGSAKIVAVI